MESGSTLRANGLTVLEDICDVSARLVVNRVAMKTKRERIRQIIDGLGALLAVKQEGTGMIPILREGIRKSRGELKRRVMNRSQLQNEEVSRIVKEIVARVRQEGDAALFDYTAKFDHVTMTAETVLVTKDEIARAYAAASPEWLDAMREAARRITAFHEKQKQNTWLNFDPAISLGQKVTPLKRVGVYVPGGTAAYPSSVLMNVLPAKVAGVKEIIMVTPPGRDGSVSYPLALVAADLAGVDKIYKVGGAQAIAALAFGTESIPRVDKITGPGNIFVANAKREVFGHVGIDMVAGPSEVLVIADESANPRYVAADLLSQAEHDPLAAAILVTDSEALAAAVQAEIARQTALLPRRDVIEKSLTAYGTIVVAPTLPDCADIANQIAPEHMELSVADPYGLLPLIENAGAIFLGHYSPEPLGDYLAGPNHVLPTSGTARFFSPLSVVRFRVEEVELDLLFKGGIGAGVGAGDAAGTAGGAGCPRERGSRCGMGEGWRSHAKANYGSAPKPGSPKRVKGQCPLQGQGTASLAGLGAAPQLFPRQTYSKESSTRCRQAKRPCH